MSTAVIWSKSKPDVEFHYGGRLGVWIQWHVIPEPRITLQGAATWWIHCHDSRATCHTAALQGVRIPSAILKIVSRHIWYFFLFLMQFRIWRAVAFVSSPIHLFDLLHHYMYQCLGVLLWSTDVLTERLPLLFGVPFSTVNCVVMLTFLANRLSI